MCYASLAARGVSCIRTVRKPEQLRHRKPRPGIEKLKVLKENRLREARRAAAKVARRKRKRAKKEREARKILRQRKFLH